MARIPAAELERLKLSVSVERLIEAAGIVLKPHGKDRIGRCPFHDDKTPSLVVSPKSNLWHCLGACQMGGSVVDWVMRWEGVSFRRAIEMLRGEIGEAVGLEVAVRAEGNGATAPAARTAALEVAPEAAGAASDAALMTRVIDYYHATLKQSPEALAYLAKRGLDHPEAVERFKLGFANRTLGYRLPSPQTQAGAALKAQLVRLGLYRDSGHEHFNGSLVVPIIDAAGVVTEVYGRKIGARLREGTPLHLYLPGPHRGVFNEQGLVGQEEVILTEALIDALTFWCAGHRNVTASYGVEGFTDDHIAAFRRHGIKRVLIAYDADAAGNAAAEKLAAKLMSAGFGCYRCVFPKGMDANDYALHVQPASRSLGLVIRQAHWMGNGAPPPRPSVEASATSSDASRGVGAEQAPVPAAVESPDLSALVAELEAARETIPITADAAALSAAAVPEPPARVVPSSAPALPVERDGDELRVTLGERVYRVRGIEKNLSYEQLRVWLKVSAGDYVHVDTVELYQAKQRAAWIKAASVELGIAEDIAKSDLAKVLRAVEQEQDRIIRRELGTPADATPALPADEREAGLALLRDPKLIERIIADVTATGVVGESSNALVAYLACVSRKLDKPLAVLIQSTSAAGKSTLMDAILALMPEAERVHYSAMTGQSLFYLGEQSMKHKILAIAEEEGVRQAAYALKVLQSQGELTIASTGKDPSTGQLVTQTYRVEGPVMLFLTTTAIDVDEELLNRCLVLTIDETREQTAAIQARQRTGRTLSGLIAKARSTTVLAAHRAAQTLLRPLAVVNPFAEALTFASDRVRTRRDHQKYLALIDAIALLHQYQRPIRTVQQGGRTLEYVEVTPDDVALANRLAHDVLGRSLDELPPQTRRLLAQIVAYVEAQCQAQAIERRIFRFTRRELREATRLGDTQLKVHLARLEDQEYLVVHRRGLRHEYELAFDGRLDEASRQMIGLRDLDGTTTTDWSAQTLDRSGVGRGSVGPRSGDGRADLSPFDASADAAFTSLVAALDPAAPLGPTPAVRRTNGASYPSGTRN